MPTLLDEPPERTRSSPAERLRGSTAAVRLAFEWFGVRKTLTREQKAQAADTFDAEGKFLSAGKKLFDTAHPQFKAVTAVKGQIQSLWKGMTLPYPESGIRLIRQDDIAIFDVQMTTLKSELASAVTALDDHFAELMAAARRARLGRLFNSADYPDSLLTLFDVAWEFPSVEPPDYLRQLSPALFEQEQARVTARFDEAVRLAEEAFTAELTKLVSHLADRLSGAEDGQPKVFRDSAVSNLAEFFERFRHLNIRSSEELDQLVGQAQRIIGGVAPGDLRASNPLRRQVATELAQVQSALDGLMVDRPRRRLLRGEAR